MDGPFPSVPEDGGLFLTVSRRCHFPGLLRKPQATGEGLLPDVERDHDPLAEGLRQGIDFLRELSHEAAAAVTAFHDCPSPLPHEGAQAVQGRKAFVGKAVFELLKDAVTVEVYELRAEPFLALEIIIERTSRNARPLQDFIDTHGGKSFFRHNFHSGMEQRFPSEQLVAAFLGRPPPALGLRRWLCHGVIFETDLSIKSTK